MAHESPKPFTTGTKFEKGIAWFGGALPSKSKTNGIYRNTLQSGEENGW